MPLTSDKLSWNGTITVQIFHFEKLFLNRKCVSTLYIPHFHFFFFCSGARGKLFLFYLLEKAKTSIC